MGALRSHKVPNIRSDYHCPDLRAVPSPKPFSSAFRAVPYAALITSTSRTSKCRSFSIVLLRPQGDDVLPLDPSQEAVSPTACPDVALEVLEIIIVNVTCPVGRDTVFPDPNSCAEVGPFSSQSLWNQGGQLVCSIETREVEYVGLPEFLRLAGVPLWCYHRIYAHAGGFPHHLLAIDIARPR